MTGPRQVLDQLDAAREAATPGPWEHIVDDHGRKGVEHSVWSSEEGGIDGAYISEQVGDPADAALIVAAVNALPGLLAAVRAVADLADELDGWPVTMEPTDAAARIRTALAAAMPAEAQRLARMRARRGDTSGQAVQRAACRSCGKPVDTAALGVVAEHDDDDRDPCLGVGRWPQPRDAVAGHQRDHDDLAHEHRAENAAAAHEASDGQYGSTR